jgi:hypothetical protein
VGSPALSIAKAHSGTVTNDALVGGGSCSPIAVTLNVDGSSDEHRFVAAVPLLRPQGSPGSTRADLIY